MSLALKLLVLLNAAVIYGFLFWGSLRRPRFFVWFYLIVSTQFFGFVDHQTIEIEGLFNVMLFLNITMVISSIVLVILGRRSLKGARWFLIGVTAVFIFGTVNPVLNGHSGVFHAVTDGKDITTYALLAYLLVNRRAFRYKNVERIFRILGVVLACILVYGRIAQHPLPAYDLLNENFPQQGIRVSHEMYIYLGFLLTMARGLQTRFSQADLIILVIMFAGLAAQGHRSILLGAIGTVGLLAIYTGRLRVQMKLYAGAALCGMLGFAFVGLEGIRELLILPVQEILQQGGAIEARFRLNAIRWSYFVDRPWFGYGFIDNKSPLGQELVAKANSPHAQLLGTIDAGYIDLLTRFGIVGAVVILSAYLPFIRQALSDRSKYVVVMFGFYLFSLYVVSITWSPLTYEFGIVTISFVMFLIIKYEERPVPLSNKHV